jgi:hypothetical protein
MGQQYNLLFIQSQDFESGLGLDVRIRTKLRGDMTYISSAVLRIGSDVLEVESQGVYWFNGVLDADLLEEFSGFAFSHKELGAKRHVFEVHLGGREGVKLMAYKDFVSVPIKQGRSEHFLNSVGLTRDFTRGCMIARDDKLSKTMRMLSVRNGRCATLIAVASRPFVSLSIRAFAPCPFPGRLASSVAVSWRRRRSTNSLPRRLVPTVGVCRTQ